jgi:hypothetical protein
MPGEDKLSSSAYSGQRMIRRKKEERLRVRIPNSVLHSALLLRLFLLSVRWLVHPVQHLQRSLLKNSPIFFEPIFQTVFPRRATQLRRRNL